MAWVKALSPQDKRDIGLRCERLIAEVLRPRYLPEIRPSAFNYPIGLSGRWRGCKYSFIVRFRSGFPDNAGEEFDTAFARFDHDETSLREARVHVMWRRHTGQWWRLRSALTLDEALRLMESDPVLRPPI